MKNNMPNDLTPAYGSATNRQQKSRMSPLIRGIFGCMSAESSVATLARTLASSSKPDLEPLKCGSLLRGATLSFKNNDGGEDLTLSIKHTGRSLIVEVNTPSGLWDRKEIASNLRRILESATDGQMNFRQLEKDIAASAYSTNSSPIYYRGTFDIPAGLNTQLMRKAQTVFDRDAAAQITVGKGIDQLLGKVARTEGNVGPQPN